MEQTTRDEAIETLVFLSKQQVLKKIPITAPTLWSWVRAGKFPRPRAIFNKTVWVAAEVEKALAEHVARHPEDVGRTVEDFNWILRTIVRPAA
jgi:predicted DNA-binding transcriptional regulator AlpA